MIDLYRNSHIFENSSYFTADSDCRWVHLPERFRSDLSFATSLLVDQPLASQSLLIDRPYLVIGSCLVMPSSWVADTYQAAFIAEPCPVAGSFLAMHRQS